MEKKLVNRIITGGRSRKLNDEQVNDIVDLYNKGMTQKKLAEQYNVSLSTLRNYLKERRYNK